jgi:hypothetical protein
MQVFPKTFRKNVQPQEVSLSDIRIASPCPADWEKMVGDERVRHCAECNLNVYNLSAMTERQARQLLAGNSGKRMCLRLYRRADGTIITQDCPWAFRALKRRATRFASAVLSAVISVGVAAAKPKPKQNPQPATQSQRGESGLEVTVVDAQGAVIPDAEIILSRTKEKTVCVLVAKASTDSVGRGQLSALPEGEYTLTVSAQHFKIATQTITLGTRQLVSLQVQLTVGQGTTTVEVGGADIFLLETTQSQVTHAYAEPHLQTMPGPSGHGAGPRPLRP